MIGWERSLTLLHSSYNYEYLKRQPIKILVKLLQFSREAEIESRAWDKWLIRYLAAHFTKDPQLEAFTGYVKSVNTSGTITDEEYDDIKKRAEETKARHQKTIKR